MPFGLLRAGVPEELAEDGKDTGVVVVVDELAFEADGEVGEEIGGALGGGEQPAPERLVLERFAAVLALVEGEEPEGVGDGGEALALVGGEPSEGYGGELSLQEVGDGAAGFALVGGGVWRFGGEDGAELGGRGPGAEPPDARGEIGGRRGGEESGQRQQREDGEQMRVHGGEGG